MNKITKKITANLALIILILLLTLGAFIIYISYVDYQPGHVETLLTDPDPDTLLLSEEFKLLSWNIGYAGLGAEMDFFYEGGDMVGPSRPFFEKYLEGIAMTFQAMDSIHFFLFQEVDVHSKRSYFINERDLIVELFPGYDHIFAKNYDVEYVPVPLMEPMGQVYAGLLTMSKFRPSEAKRYAFPNIASWPEKLFLPDRCFVETRYPLENGRELIFLNTHNSAYVSEDSLRDLELHIIRKKMLEEYEKSNYVIAGGDWNMNPPFQKAVHLKTPDNYEEHVLMLEKDYFPPGWKFAFDPHYPTNRSVSSPYVKGETAVSIIDFFILSPNINKLKVETIHLDFENSDHHPVFLKVKLLLKEIQE
ncbi:MAG: hypothetical protein K9G67_10255 [Bacteroidales bacterium]|nr:hypothetical protein [Bacteroidales bacterium]MCF8344147.1 hypothetical protein [Bacteroidales bacterium]MCF8349984.1 hypothetical protein [Bacteroidales bacterium]MCF8376726.1 hypothetical protein [Bacteroidales bacterium]